MKELFIGIGCTILFITSIIFQSDFNRFIREYEHLKHVVDEAAASANLCLEDLNVTEGKRIFNQEECKKAVEFMLIDGLNLKNNLEPSDKSYWQETLYYQAYYLDESTVTLPYLFTDPKTGYSKLVTKPTVVITVDAGKPRVIFAKDTTFRAIRCSAYDGLED